MGLTGASCLPATGMAPGDITSSSKSRYADRTSVRPENAPPPARQNGGARSAGTPRGRTGGTASRGATDALQPTSHPERLRHDNAHRGHGQPVGVAAGVRPSSRADSLRAPHGRGTASKRLSANDERQPVRRKLLLAVPGRVVVVPRIPVRPLLWVGRVPAGRLFHAREPTHDLEATATVDVYGRRRSQCSRVHGVPPDSRGAAPWWLEVGDRASPVNDGRRTTWAPLPDRRRFCRHPASGHWR